MRTRSKVIGGLLLLGIVGSMMSKPSIPELAETRTSCASSGAYSGPRFLGNRPDSIALDYRTGDLYIRTKLSAARPPRPRCVWVWAFFLNDREGPESSRSDLPIALDVDFGEVDTLTVEARGRFHWWDNALITRDGRTFARVLVSAHSADSAQQRVAERDRALVTMVPVTVIR